MTTTATDLRRVSDSTLIMVLLLSQADHTRKLGVEHVPWYGMGVRDVLNEMNRRVAERLTDLT